ncbi:MAG: hypothetical protein Rubg2KO_40360 [Rubricoccaceae bacterium]
MTASLRLARALALIALVGGTTVLAPTADAQRRSTIPTYTLNIGGLDILYAVNVEIAGSSLTQRSNLARATRITLDGLTLPNGGAKGGDCGFEVGDTCNGRITVRPTGGSSQPYCVDLWNIVISSPLVAVQEGGSSDLLTEQVSINYETAQSNNDCKTQDD